MTEAQQGDHGSLTPTELEQCRAIVGRINAVFEQRIVGQASLRRALITSLMAGGHLLLESVPGLAKTLAAQTLAEAIGGSFRRIQCTPDLMPNDIIGTQIYNFTTGEFTTQLGPVHANLVLLDEINRSSAKTQSAMLEAMQERQTSIAGTVYRLPSPFMVVATQNPIEEEGTYVLPEAQMDRFLMKEVLSYPTPAEEAEMLERLSDGRLHAPLAQEPVSLQELTYLQSLVDRVYVSSAIKYYIVAVVNTTRRGGPQPVERMRTDVRIGASPRGSIALMRVAQALALAQGRGYVLPEDVKLLRHAVLRHRIVRTYDAIANNVAPEVLIDAAFEAVWAP